MFKNNCIVKETGPGERRKGSARFFFISNSVTKGLRLENGQKLSNYKATAKAQIVPTLK